MVVKRNPDVTREKLLQAAFQEIYRSGFQAASLDNIIASAGVTKGALYHHFPSKKALGYAVVDEEGRQMYPLGGVVFNDRDVTPYEWSADNLKEVQNGILTKCDTVADLAAAIGCEDATLRASLDAWNEACAAGRDGAHNRPAQTMAPIRTPPFYVGEIWPVVSNTQGGPVHDAKQRVLNPFGEPIPRLYEAGEVGSIWGHLYLSGANLSECFIGGRIAGREAAALGDWDG